MRTLIVAVILAMASSGSARADDCETFYRRVKPHVQATYELADAQFGGLVAECRDDVRRGDAKTVAAVQCVLAAKDDAGVKGMELYRAPAGGEPKEVASTTTGRSFVMMRRGVPERGDRTGRHGHARSRDVTSGCLQARPASPGARV